MELAFNDRVVCRYQESDCFVCHPFPAQPFALDIICGLSVVARRGGLCVLDGELRLGRSEPGLFPRQKVSSRVSNEVQHDDRH